MTPQEQRELLELAAYAVGLEFGTEDDKPWLGVDWNPLTNKSDAFDLMVKLHLSVMSNETASWVAAGMHQIVLSDVFHDGSNPEAATMLAITRAAAVVGKQMKEQMK